jgi:hypothetical protein
MYKGEAGFKKEYDIPGQFLDHSDELTNGTWAWTKKGVAFVSKEGVMQHLKITKMQTVLSPIPIMAVESDFFFLFRDMEQEEWDKRYEENTEV